MRHSVTIKCLQYWHKAWLGSICTGNKSGLKQIHTLNLIMIAKYSEHIDTEVNADQKYKRHTELRCPVATSDKCTPHQICIQGLKYIRNILKSVFFSGADLLRKKIGEQQVNCSPSPLSWKITEALLSVYTTTAGLFVAFPPPDRKINNSLTFKQKVTVTY